MRRRNREKGFLMVEVMVATVVIAVALVAIGGMFIQSQRANISAGGYTAAACLAQEKLELFKTVADPGTIANEQETVQLNNTIFTRSVVIEAGPNPDIVRARVRVSWNEPGGTRNVEMYTFYVKTAFSQYPVL